jgi:hypothetical protein
MDTTQSCLDCKCESPKTDSDYTLISMGWRLARPKSRGSAASVEWRCPACWAKFKVASGLSSTGSWSLPDDAERPSMRRTSPDVKKPGSS